VTFLSPHALWVLGVLPALVGAYLLLLRRKAAAPFRYPSIGTIRKALVPGEQLRRHMPPVTLFLGLATLLLGIARPAAVAMAPAERGTVILAMDVSLSMAATDVAPTRLAAAQAAARAFIEAQPTGVLIGIVAFAGHADVVQAPTANRSELMEALAALRFRRYTSIGNGLVAALATLYPDANLDGEYDIFADGHRPRGLQDPLLQYPEGRKPFVRVARGSDLSSAIVLVSDGRGALGVPHLTAAKMAADRGVRVHTIGIGTLYGGTAYVEGMPPMHADFEEETLQQIAAATGGDYFYAKTADKVKRIYEKLARRVVFEKRESEITALFGAIGAVLSLVAAALSLLWFNPPLTTGARPRGIH
jgi:Ca-activated chloride channel family protein